MELAHYIWFEKHRPQSLGEMSLRPEQQQQFEAFLEDQNIPHLLFYGPPGSGKTTVAFILLDNIPTQRLVLNASSADRGVGTIKGRVKEFARSQPIPGRLKVVFLDEADGLTPDAKEALRNTMEAYSSQCRFILTANHVDKINPAIMSRCVRMEFSQYPKRSLYGYLRGILKEEDVKFHTDDLHLLIERLYPDIRSIVNGLQQGSLNGEFNFELVENLAFDPAQLETLINKGDVKGLRGSWAGVTDFLWLYKYLFDDFIFSVEEELRPPVAQAIAEHMYRDALVVDREINFTSCCIGVMVTLGVKMKF